MGKKKIQKIRKPYLIYIKLGYDVVKQCVQIIEQFHNLMRIIVSDMLLMMLMGGRFAVSDVTSRAVLEEERAVKPELMWMSFHF